jgi:hypothetical protein
MLTQQLKLSLPAPEEYSIWRQNTVSDKISLGVFQLRNLIQRLRLPGDVPDMKCPWQVKYLHVTYVSNKIKLITKGTYGKKVKVPHNRPEGPEKG